MRSLSMLTLGLATLVPFVPRHTPKRDVDGFVRQLQTTVPDFLRASGVPGAAVALVRDGRIVYRAGFGTSDRVRGTRVTSATQFNVGSISKSLTAWGVMRLVEQGRIALDEPVDRYLRRWHLPPSRWNADGVTVRRLLSHTAGLSRASVHEYAAGEAIPDLPGALASDSDGVVVGAEPGAAFAYSGGGYMVLQLLIEDVSHRRFADFMRDEVLLPLGMRASTFDNTTLDPARLATPYDSGHAIATHRYAGLAAAGLYTTLDDLAAFAAAGMRGANGEAPGRGVLSPATVALLQTAAPGANSGFGFHYGLGYNLYPLGNSSGPNGILGDGVAVPGHMGQNTGWGAVFWTLPHTGDALVVLTNASNGYDAFRWILCDWLRWAAIPSFGYICRGRQLQTHGVLGDALFAREWRERSPRDPAVDSLVRHVVIDSGPGAAVLVARDGRVLHAAGYGVADLVTREEITEDTPFYLASLAKPFTASLALLLAREGRLRLDTPLARVLPEIGALDPRVTIERLLTHTSGVVDYYSLIHQWPFPGTLGNAAVVDSLRGRPLAFEPGARTRYGNSNYVLLASAIARATGRDFSTVLRERVLAPAGMASTTVLDDGASPPPHRAIGYDTLGGRIVVSDYGASDRRDGTRAFVDLRTVGAGGMFASLRDLASWNRALAAHTILDSTTAQDAERAHVAAPDEHGIDPVDGYGYGWVVSRRWNERVVWQDGAYAGFRTVALRVPSQALTIIVLSNFATLDQRALALSIADRYVRQSR